MNLIVEFSGWAKLDPDKTFFVNIGEEKENRIDGNAWLKLDEDQRSDYILENVIDCQRDALDGSYEHIDIIVEEDFE